MKHVRLEKRDWQLSCCTFSRSSVSGCQREVTCEPEKVSRGQLSALSEDLWKPPKTFSLAVSLDSAFYRLAFVRAVEGT